MLPARSSANAVGRVSFNNGNPSVPARSRIVRVALSQRARPFSVGASDEIQTLPRVSSKRTDIMLEARPFFLVNVAAIGADLSASKPLTAGNWYSPSPVPNHH